jgi:hypothetical protein
MKAAAKILKNTNATEVQLASGIGFPADKAMPTVSTADAGTSRSSSSAVTSTVVSTLLASSSIAAPEAGDRLESCLISSISNAQLACAMSDCR